MQQPNTVGLFSCNNARCAMCVHPLAFPLTLARDLMPAAPPFGLMQLLTSFFPYPRLATISVYNSLPLLFRATACPRLTPGLRRHVPTVRTA